jgi:hypothetical protein
MAWYFDFPVYTGVPMSCVADQSCSSVHYVTTPVDAQITGGQHLSATLQVNTTGDPVFQYQFNPDNTCISPAHVRPFLQRKNDPMTAEGEAEFYRWWATPIAYELAAGSTTLTVPLTPDQWLSVFGKLGNSSASATAGFQAALLNLGNVGFTFGGGCFYGHGVNISRGTARFTLIKFSITP